nr:unnamed protein product [Digitaria exilis]
MTPVEKTPRTLAHAQRAKLHLGRQPPLPGRREPAAQASEHSEGGFFQVQEPGFEPWPVGTPRPASTT